MRRISFRPRIVANQCKKGSGAARQNEVMSASPAFALPAILQRRVEAAVARLYEPEGRAREDFSRPAGEPALCAPDSVSWAVCKNPVVLFVGGVAAVVLELAEPRVRTGVWEHSAFREQPLERMRRTALATAMAVYGPRSRAEAMIARVARLHDAVRGATPHGDAYAANDPELLAWVQATALHGFVEAHHAYVRPLDGAARDRFHAEGMPVARLYGVIDPPASQADVQRVFERMDPRLEASDIVHEFLSIVRRMPALAAPLRPVQALLVRAAVDVVPAPLRERLGLRAQGLAAWQRPLVCRLARAADRLVLASSAPVQACRRLGLRDDFLYR